MFSLFTHQHKLSHFIAHLHSLQLCLIKKFGFVFAAIELAVCGKTSRHIYFKDVC